MDTRFLGSNLTARGEIRSDSRRPSREAAEDAYYKRYAPADGRLVRIASIVTVVCLAFVTIGFWPR